MEKINQGNVSLGYITEVLKIIRPSLSNYSSIFIFKGLVILLDMDRQNQRSRTMGTLNSEACNGGERI